MISFKERFVGKLNKINKNGNILHNSINTQRSDDFIK